MIGRAGPKASEGSSQAAIDRLGRSRRLPDGAAPASASRCVPEWSLSEAAPNAVAATPSCDGYLTIGIAGLRRCRHPEPELCRVGDQWHAGRWQRDTATGLGTLIGDSGGYGRGSPPSGNAPNCDYRTGGFATVIRDTVSCDGLDRQARRAL